MARPAISLSILNETVTKSDLPEQSKKHLSYCIHRFARLLGRGLDMEINETLLFHRPDLHSAGLTAGSLANIRSGVRAALRLTNRIGPETQSRAWVGAIDRARAWNGPGRRRRRGAGVGRAGGAPPPLGPPPLPPPPAPPADLALPIFPLKIFVNKK